MNPQSVRRRRGVDALLSVVAGVAVLGLSACAAPTAETTSDEVKVAVASLDATFDPMNGASLWELPQQAVYEPLIALESGWGNMVPWLAEDFVMSDDRRTLTFTLREGVEFSDGVALDAAAIDTYFQALYDSEGWGFAQLFRDIYQVDIAAADDRTVVFTSGVSMDANFLALVSLVPIASPVVADDPTALADEQIGTGAYTIEDVNPGVSMTFVRNPDHWNVEAYPYERMTMRAYSDSVAALNALKTEQVDAAAIETQYGAEAEASGFEIFEGGITVNSLVIYDHEGEMVPALGDIRVREAMNLAFDREQIAATLDFGYARVSSQGANGDMGDPYYLEGKDDAYSYDVERAKELLAEAGYPDGFDLQIATVGMPTYEPIVQQSLADIGIRVHYATFADAAAAYAAIGTGDYPVILMPTAGLEHWFEPGAFPVSDDPVIVELGKKVEGGTLEEAVEARRAIAEYAFENIWYVAFSQPSTIWAAIPEIELTLGIWGAPRIFQIVPAA